MRPHPLHTLAVWLIAAAAGMLVALFIWIGVDATEAGAKSTVLPKSVGRVSIVWVRVPTENSDIRCYVARQPTSTRAGVWICG